MSDDFTIDEELRTLMLDAITGGALGTAMISAVDIIAPLVILNGEPALVAVARLLADKIIADTGLRAEYGDTIGVKDPDGNLVTLDTALHATARNQVLAYQFVAARLEGDQARQVQLGRVLDDGGSGLCEGLCAAVRTHHLARALEQQQ